jgi:hypothetical protein
VATLEASQDSGRVVGVNETIDEAEVRVLSDDYEAALLAHDLEAMNAVFWTDVRTLRFGIADIQRGDDELAAWRAEAPPVPPTRTITTRPVLELVPGVVAVDLTFVNGDDPTVGRQSQTWVRRPGGWRIVRAHVSMQR